MTLAVRNLSKHFFDPKRGEFLAVNDVSLTCEAGQIFGLLGPNGAGKTTTLRMIGTLLTPDAGNITVQGFDVGKDPTDVRKRIGFLAADTGLYDRLTPRETLTYFARVSLYPEDKIEERVNTVISLLDLNSFADTLCEKLSTGMRQKVSIARTVVHDPPVMILDEPTNGLDVLAIQAMHRFIRLCREQGKCVLMSTHIMAEAEKLCDQIGILHNGKIFANGTLNELREQTGKHYLEDIFIAVVKEEVGEFL